MDGDTIESLAKKLHIVEQAREFNELELTAMRKQVEQARRDRDTRLNIDPEHAALLADILAGLTRAEDHGCTPYLVDLLTSFANSHTH